MRLAHVRDSRVTALSVLSRGFPYPGRASGLAGHSTGGHRLEAPRPRGLAELADLRERWDLHGASTDTNVPGAAGFQHALPEPHVETDSDLRLAVAVDAHALTSFRLGLLDLSAGHREPE